MLKLYSSSRIYIRRSKLPSKGCMIELKRASKAANRRTMVAITLEDVLTSAGHSCLAPPNACSTVSNLNPPLLHPTKPQASTKQLVVCTTPLSNFLKIARINPSNKERVNPDFALYFTCTKRAYSKTLLASKAQVQSFTVGNRNYTVYLVI